MEIMWANEEPGQKRIAPTAKFTVQIRHCHYQKNERKNSPRRLGHLDLVKIL